MLHPATPGFLPSNLSHSPTLKMAVCFSFIVTHTHIHKTHTHIHTQTTCQVHLIFSVYICGCGCTANKLHWRRLTQRAKLILLLPEDIRRLHLLATGGTPKAYLYYKLLLLWLKEHPRKKREEVFQKSKYQKICCEAVSSQNACTNKTGATARSMCVFIRGGPTPRHTVLQSTKN